MYEEEKFMRSPLKKEYMDYKESTGRFLPKMIF
jgi:protein-S-isoprenylcysteine O-methyltransferase Ste14